MVGHWIGGDWFYNDKTFKKYDPTTGSVCGEVCDGGVVEVCTAVGIAKATQPLWELASPVNRASYLEPLMDIMRRKTGELVAAIQRDTGKRDIDAIAEVESSLLLARFYVGEGQRLYGRTTTSSDNRWAMTIRQPYGVAALITAWNMPLANIVWKVFPALICGNAVVLKPSEDAPLTAEAFASQTSVLPAGVFNMVQGRALTGEYVVGHHDVNVASFTGSTGAGTCIGKECASRHIKCSLEMGGKNAFVVCDDADFDSAVQWAIKSAYSLGGQRCASASRIYVFNAIYDRFKDAMLAAMPRMTQPIINEAQLTEILKIIAYAVDHGSQILVGGHRMKDDLHRNGFYVAPTLVENATPDIDRIDLFGPVASLHRVADLADAIREVNNSEYGLTSCIHTTDIRKAMAFVNQVKSGVVSVNRGTYGSEPHMPFGGLGKSGNGTREPGIEALDVYSRLKTVYIA